MAFNVFAFNVFAFITRTTHSSTRVPPQASCLDESRIATIQGNSPWGTISKLISMITIPHGHIININILGHYQNTFNRSQYLIPIPPRPGCPRFPSTQSWCFPSWRRNMISHKSDLNLLALYGCETRVAIPHSPSFRGLEPEPKGWVQHT